jgi:hypothetical protein
MQVEETTAERSAASVLLGLLLLMAAFHGSSVYGRDIEGRYVGLAQRCERVKLACANSVATDKAMCENKVTKMVVRLALGQVRLLCDFVEGGVHCVHEVGNDGSRLRRQWVIGRLRGRLKLCKSVSLNLQESF